jgi:hypothetical protein
LQELFLKGYQDEVWKPRCLANQHEGLRVKLKPVQAHNPTFATASQAEGSRLNTRCHCYLLAILGVVWTRMSEKETTEVRKLVTNEAWHFIFKSCYLWEICQVKEHSPKVFFNYD